MTKLMFASDAVDEVIDPLFSRDRDDEIRELVEKSVVRVVGQDLTDLGIDLDVIADAVVAEEFDNLTEGQRQAVNERVAEELTGRLQEIFREHAGAVLRG